MAGETHPRRPSAQLVSEPDDFTVFLTANGEPFSRDHLTFAVRERISAAKLGKGGACHLFRHTRVTLMHENGADIRHIQAILGHEDIKTTQIYTQVAIRALHQIHAATHPAEAQGTIQAARMAAEREGLLRRWQPRPRKMKNWAAKRKTGMRVSL